MDLSLILKNEVMKKNFQRRVFLFPPLERPSIIYGKINHILILSENLKLKSRL